jgi:plasmid stabilization system protein ParE
MSYNLVLQKEAILDIQEAFGWYEKQKNGLGFILIEEIDICFEKLTEHPEYYTYISKNYRRIKVNRFPYLIIYEIEGNDVIINSVHHVRQRLKL